MAVLLTSMLISAAPLHAQEVGSANGDEIAADSNVSLEGDASQRRPLNLDIIGGTSYDGMPYTGLRFGIPIVPKGFSPLNDSFDLEMASYTFFIMPYHELSGFMANPVLVTALIGFRYSFYPTAKCTLYLRTLFGVGMSPYFPGDTVTFAVDAGVGAYWNFSKYVGMNFDISYLGVTIGFSFKFGNIGK